LEGVRRVLNARLLHLAFSIGLLTTLGSCSKHDGDGGSTPGTPPSPPPPNAAIVYTAIGASDAMGIGGSVPCLPFTDCPNGTGYVPRVARELEADGHPLTLRNFGIPGAVLSPSIQEVGNQVGLGIAANMLGQEAPFVPTDATLVTVFAGANDANTVATAIDRGAAGSTDPNTFIDQYIQNFAADYVTLVRTIRQRAPNARIIILNVPNLSGLPYMTGRPLRDRRWIQRLAVGFATAGANAQAQSGAIVLDFLCDARSYQAGNYSSDGFHPDDSGYAFMAGVILEAVNAASWPTPASSCSQMALVQ
jgi:lysophospholipase L1-like esterase